MEPCGTGDSRCKRLAAALLLLALVVVACVCCGPAYPPDERILVPRVALDARGNVIAMYQVNIRGTGPRDYLQKISPQGDRLWGEEGVRLDERELDFFLSGIPDQWANHNPLAMDEHGNATAFWAYDGQIYAEHLDGNGDPSWQPKQLVVGTYYPPGVEYPWTTAWAVATNGANATIAWTDQNWRLNLQSLGSDGNLLWSREPMEVSTDELALLRDRNGNTWLMRADDQTRGVYLQVIDQAGNAVWAEEQELHKTDSNGPGDRRYTVWLAEDGAGGVIAGWMFGDDAPLELRTVSLAGEIQVSAAESFFQQNEAAILPYPIADAQDGLVVLWTSGGSIFAQRIDSKEAMSWGSSGIVVASGFVPAGNRGVGFQASSQPGGTVVIWEDWTATGKVWRAQRIDSQGNLLWPDEGVIMAEATEADCHWQWLATTSDGAVILSGAETESSYRRSRLQKISPDGRVLWGKDGLRLDDWREGPLVFTSP